MTRRRKLVLSLVLIVTLSIGSVLVYLAVSDLSGWRDTVARFASNAMDRELTIGGEFEVDLGVVTRVRATELTLANTGWGSEPIMARIDRLDGEINLWELLSGSIHLSRVDIEGGRAIFESDPDAGSNWRLGKADSAGDDSGDAGPVRLRIDRIKASDVTLIFGSATDEHHVDLVVDTLDSTGDPEGMHQLASAGSLRDTAYSLAGRFGSFTDLINLEPIDHDLRATLGSAEIQSAGTIGRIADLGDLNIEAKANIPNLTEIYRLLGLDSTFDRQLEMEITTTAASGLTDFTLTTTGRAAELTATGRVDALVSPENLDVTIDFAGSDIRPIAALAGITDLDEEPFSLEGRVAWSGFPIEVTDLEIRVGDNRISADGRVGRPPLMLDTDFEIHGAGPDIASVTAMVGLDLPHDPFSIDGRLVRVEDGLRVEHVRGAIGTTWVAADGFIGDPPAYLNTRLDLELREPDLSRFGPALGLALPEDPLIVKGRLAQGEGAIELEEVTAEVGDARLRVDGSLTTVERMVGTDLRFDFEGLDLLDIAALFEIEGLPASPVRAGGRVRFVEDGLELDPVTIEVPGATLGARGLFVPTGGLEGTTLSIDASGADASIFGPLLPAGAVPPESFRVAGGVRVERDAVSLDAMEVGFGGTNGRIDGRIGTLRDLAGTDVELRIESPSLAALDPLLPGVALPETALSVAGGIATSGDRVELRSLDVDFDVVSLRLDGVLALTDRFIGSQLRVAGEGDDLGALADGIDTALATELPVMPTEPFAVSGGIRVDEVGFHSDDLEITVGGATASAIGVVGHWPGMIGTDIEFDAEGSITSPDRAATGIDGPEIPIEATGRIRHGANGTDFGGFRFRLGEHRGEIDGRLGLLPTLHGTSLELAASGPNLDLLRRFTGLSWLPSLPFEIDGRFDGNPRRFAADGVRLRLGSSDVEGDLRVDLEAKPRVTAHLRSRRIVGPELLPPPQSAGAESGEDEPEDSPLLASDDPINLSVLDRFDGALGWTMEQLEFRFNSYTDVQVSAALESSRLDIERIAGEGRLGGRLEAAGSIAPDGESHRIELRLGLDDAMVNLAGKGTPAEQFTSVDVSIEMDATGRSTHEFLAQSNGRIVVTAEHGTVRRGIVEIISADVLATLLDALNPFGKNEKLTRLECAVLAATFDAGVMTLEPAAIQTDKVTILGDGTIDFATEKLKLDWVTKPRKGVGLSASAITNSYIRLGGTLRDPNLEIKPLEAMATTGVAVVTMGISVVARGLFDRVTAEKKVCEKAMRQAEQQLIPEQTTKKRQRR